MKTQQKLELIYKNSKLDRIREHKPNNYISNIPPYCEMKFKCPFCDSYFREWNYTKKIWYNVYGGKVKSKKNEMALEFLKKKFLRHLECIIRLRGGIGHIKLFIKLVGEKKAIEKFKEWVKINKFVGIQLNQVII